MVDRVQFSPSIGNKNLNELAASRKSEEAVISTVGGPGAVSGAQKAPDLEPLDGSGAAHESSLSNVEKAVKQQQELNSLTLSVRRAVQERPDTQQLIRDSVGDFIEEFQPTPVEGASGESNAPEIDVPGLGSGGGEIESVQAAEQAPTPEVPKTGSAPSVTPESGGDEVSGARGEVVDVVT